MKEQTATHIAALQSSSPLLNIVEASQQDGADLKDFAHLYFSLSDKLGINWLRTQINHYDIQSRWDVVARVSAQCDLDRHQRSIASAIFI